MLNVLASSHTGHPVYLGLLAPILDGTHDFVIGSRYVAGGTTDAATPPAPRDAWDDLKPGSVVLAAYWDEKNQPEGWWPAVVTKTCADGYVLHWRGNRVH